MNRCRDGMIASTGVSKPLISRLVFVFLMGWFGASVAMAETQTLQPNVFLGQWHVLGPLPKSSEASTGVMEEFFDDEQTLRAGYVRLFNNQVFTWKRHDAPSVDFRRVFGEWGKGGENVVGYAYTEFVSPKDQELLLGIAHDDEVRGWLNGEEFCRYELRTSALTDSKLERVSVRKGLNTLLLKVGQGNQGWEVAARFRPTDVDEPLLSFKCTPADRQERYPTFDVVFLDKDNQILATHQCGGLRESHSDEGRGVYTLFAKLPVRNGSASETQEEAPAKVRITAQPVGMLPVDRTFDWDDIHRRRPVIKLAASSPIRLRIVDNANGKPIKGAQAFVDRVGMSENVTDQAGLLTLPDVQPMQWRLFGVADGFAAKVLYPAFPYGSVQTIRLNRGGKILRGTVVSSDGTPLEGATVSVGYTREYEPTVTTDSKGQFKVVSLSQSLQSIRPTVSCDGYVTQQSFTQQLNDNGETVVHWSLQPAAVIAGRIVDDTTKNPIAGAKVIAGTSRFVRSNPETVSDADGRFTLQSLPSGTIVLHAISENHAPVMQSVSVKRGHTTNADFSLPKGNAITGVVNDVDGNPIEGVRLICDTWKNHRIFDRDAYTNSRGEFSLGHMPDSEAEVHVLKREFVSKRDLMVKGGDQVQVQLKPVLTHRITVRAADTGAMVPGLTLHRGYLWQPGSRPSWQSSRYEMDRYFDKLAGEMKYPVDENSSYTMLWRFRAPGFKDAVVKFPANSKEAVSVDVKMEKAATFRAVVVDEQTKKPLPNVAVALFSSDDPLRSNYVDYRSLWRYVQDGNFTGTFGVSNLQGVVTMTMPENPDEVGIALVSKNGASPIGAFSEIVPTDEADESKANAPVSLAFPRPGRLKGQLIRADKPMPNTYVKIQQEFSQGRFSPFGDRQGYSNGYWVSGRVATNANGEFDFGGLGPGTYRLYRSFHYQFPGGQMSRSVLTTPQTITIEPGQTVDHEFRLPDGQNLTGTIADEDGQPLADCLIQLSKRAGSNAWDATTSDSNGKFKLEHVPAGSYRLLAEHFPASERYTGRPQLSGTVNVDVANDPVSVKVTMKDPNAQKRTNAVPRPTPSLLQKLFQSLGG